MKSVIKIVGIAALLLIVAAIVLPFFFKDEIKIIVKNAANNNLKAKVDFTDVDLSLFKSFPNLAIGVDGLTIITKKPFEGDTLIYADYLGISVDIFSLINNDILQVKSVNLESPKMFLYVQRYGQRNYDISLKDSGTVVEGTQNKNQAKKQFNIELKSYRITNGKIAYVDQSSGVIVAVNNLNHSGSGDFTQDDFILDTETSIDEFTVEMDGIKYLNKVRTIMDMQLGINLPSRKFTMRNNELELNNLLLQFEGAVEMPGEDFAMDLKFSSPSSKFIDIISLIPAIYKNDFSSLETSGEMKFSGSINGIFSENSLPAFNVDLSIDNGKFKYPDLPTPVNDVNLTLNINNPDGKVDNTIIDLHKIHLSLGKEPIEGRLKVTKPVSGPIVDTRLKGKIDLANLKSALDLKDILQLEGTINSDFQAIGNITTTGSSYENINAEGKVSISALKYQGTESDQLLNILNASLKFNPKNVRLDNLEAKIGDSDLKAKGSLNNLISYILSDGILVGDLDLSSNYFDFNPFLSGDETESKKDKSSDTETSAFDIPENVRFTMRSKFKELIYDNLELINVEGDILVKDSRVSLNNLKMNLLDGTLSGSGYYAKSRYQENPDIQFNLSVTDFSVKKTYDKFISVQQFAPIAKYIQGSFSSNLKMRTSLNNSLIPVWETFFSNGLLNIKTAEVKNFKPFNEVGSILNLQELSNPKLRDVKPKFEIRNGRFYISPVNYKIGDYNIVLSGSNGLDQSLSYEMEIDIPAKNLKKQANSAISGLLGKDLNLVKSNSVRVKALIGGTIDSPNVKTSAADVATGVAEEVKEAIVDEAKAQADALKAEAEKKVKAEAKKKEEELKKKLEEEAKKKLKKLFKWG